MKLRLYSQYNRQLSKTGQAAVLLLKLIVNFNESLLSASFVQTFFKFFGINLWSSTIIWAFPPTLFVLLSPLYRWIFLSKKYDSFLLNMFALSMLMFFNSIGFVTLFNLETFAANFIMPSTRMFLLGGISFTLIDFTKYLFENLVFDYMTEFVDNDHQKRFKFIGILVEKIGRMIGAFISCLYIVSRKTDFDRFSETFFTNMQFSYYVAACVNITSIFLIFLLWPKNFNLQTRPIKMKVSSLFDYFCPGYSYMTKLNRSNRMLMIRLFFIYGIYWFVATNLTQFVSNKFMADYPYVISNSAIQAVDVGTSWGAVSLTMFYTQWGMMHVLVYPFLRRLFKYAKHVCRLLNLLGFFIYTSCYLIYFNKDVRYFVVLQGLSGLTYDWLLYEKIKLKVRRDESLMGFSLRERNYITIKIYETVEFMAEFTFFVFVPIVFVQVPDHFQILSLGLIMLCLSISPPGDRTTSI